MSDSEPIPAHVSDGELTPAPVDAPMSAASPPPLPSAARPKPRPVRESERFQSIDVLRGLAVFGILLVNIEGFAMVRDARYVPQVSGGDGPWNHLIWLVTFLFADTKFIAIFTMLFGAGIALMDERRRKRGARRPWAVYYRRMLFLLALGAAHGLYLWRGDILYFYAFWGLVLYFAPRLPGLVLSLGGLLLYSRYIHEFAQRLTELRGTYAWWDREIFQGTWHQQYEYRLQFEHYYLVDVPIEFSPHLIGSMLFGMALYKSGFLSGRWPRALYGIVSAVCLWAGFGLVATGTEFTPYFDDALRARQFLWGSLLLSLGYMASAVFVSQVFSRRLPVRMLASVGRIALTNYLMQTVICTTIFYGYGYGLFERTERVEQFGIVVAICAGQLLFSHVWLMAFRFGPMEWLWRSVSYLRPQPILRRRRRSKGAPRPA